MKIAISRLKELGRVLTKLKDEPYKKEVKLSKKEGFLFMRAIELEGLWPDKGPRGKVVYIRGEDVTYSLRTELAWNDPNGNVFFKKTRNQY